MIFREILGHLVKKQPGGQAAVAKAIGVSQAAISFWCSGAREPGRAELVMLADFFRVSLDYLAGRVTDPGQFKAAAAIAERFAGSDDEKQRVFNSMAAEQETLRQNLESAQISLDAAKKSYAVLMDAWREIGLAEPKPVPQANVSYGAKRGKTASSTGPSEDSDIVDAVSKAPPSGISKRRP